MGRDVNFLYPKGTQNVAYTGTAGTVTNGVSTGVRYVQVTVTSAAYVTFVGTATTSDMYLPANVPQIFKIHEGQKPSAIQVSGAGTLYVTEMTS